MTKEEKEFKKNANRKQYSNEERHLETLLNIYNIKNTDLAKLLNCNPGTISKFVNHEFVNIPINDAKKIASILNVAIDFVIFNKQEYAIKLSPMNNIYINYYDYLLLKIHGIVKDKIIYEYTSDSLYDEYYNNRSDIIESIEHEIDISDAHKYIYKTYLPYNKIKLKEILKEVDYFKFEDLLLKETTNKYYMLDYYKSLYLNILNKFYDQNYTQAIMKDIYNLK